MLNAVRRFVEQERKRSLISNKLILWEVGQDESLDHTLLSKRLYGSRKYSDVVAVCCGVSFAFEPIPCRAYYFPTLAELIKIKKVYA